MKDFIEVTQTDGSKTLVAVKEIKGVEAHEKATLIVLDFNVTKKSYFCGWLVVAESYLEIVEKIKAAQ